jgi:hypothetical protein
MEMLNATTSTDMDTNPSVILAKGTSADINTSTTPHARLHTRVRGCSGSPHTMNRANGFSGRSSD